MTPADPIEAIQKAARWHGSVAEFSRSAGLSASYVHDVLRGRRPPSDALLSSVGLSRVVVKFEPAPKPLTVADAELSVRTGNAARRIWGDGMLLSDLIAKSDDELKAAGFMRKSIKEIREIGETF